MINTFESSNEYPGPSPESEAKLKVVRAESLDEIKQSLAQGAEVAIFSQTTGKDEYNRFAGREITVDINYRTVVIGFQNSSHALAFKKTLGTGWELDQKSCAPYLCFRKSGSSLAQAKEDLKAAFPNKLDYDSSGMFLFSPKDVTEPEPKAKRAAA